MQIGVPLETYAGETRISATPETVKKLIDQGHRVIIQSGTGVDASQPDSAYKAAGAMIDSAAEAFGADLVLEVIAPSAAKLVQMRSGAVLVGMLSLFDNENIARMAERGVTAFTLGAAPHTSRTQSLDVLPLQASIAGCRAVIFAANHYPRFVPMLMTTTGTVKAIRVLILGAGVAGPQAIATARCLGAVIKASDVRLMAKGQIESLGAKFIDVPYETDEERECTEDVGDYARPMPASWMERQAKAVHERIRQSNIVITTASIPDRKALTLLHEATVTEIKPGSVVIDLAAAQGGSRPLTEVDQVVARHGVTVVGHSNLTALIPADASALYAHNILDFLELILNTEGFSVSLENDIIATYLMCHGGQAVRKNS